MQKATNDIAIFLFIVSFLIVALVVFIVIMLYTYRQKQFLFFQNLEQIKLDHEKNLLATQLEIQEQTFQNISREIHDNISLSLTLAKLQLNTMNLCDKEQAEIKLTKSIELISKSIVELSDISKGLNADIIKQQGLIKALEDETRRIWQAGLFSVDSQITGNPIYMDAQKELIIFRTIQEAFNNIIKHAAASHIQLNLHYNQTSLSIEVCDNGNGFDPNLAGEKNKAGLKNMKTRIKMLGGTMNIHSQPGQGSTLSFTIPFE